MAQAEVLPVDDSFPEANGMAPPSTLSESAQIFNYDYIMEKYLGGLGKYQFPFLFWLCFPIASSSIIIMCYSFTGGVPDYRLILY